MITITIETDDPKAEDQTIIIDVEVAEGTSPYFPSLLARRLSTRLAIMSEVQDVTVCT